MLRLSWVPFVVLAAVPVACTSHDKGGADGGLDAGLDGGSPDAGCHPSTGDAIADEWICAHDAVRASANPPPSPTLNGLSWNVAAASTATAWAAGCTWGHNPDAGYGENLAASTASTFAPTDAVSLWASEAAYYSYSTNTCSSGTYSCLHYTQLVWRATTSVGWALQQCVTGNPLGSGTWWFAVCDYDPPGNVIGQWPY